MALSYTGMQTRFNNSLSILGDPGASVIADIIIDATRRFISIMDTPMLSASLSVTTSSGPYDVPATIRKIADIRNSSNVSQEYVYDATTNKITFVKAPLTSGTYTIYGLPKEVRTNISTIIAAISEDYESVLWAYIRAFAYSWADHPDAIAKLQEADKLAFEERQSSNYPTGHYPVSIKQLDTRGNLIADSSNYEGNNVDIGDQFENDL